MPSALLIEKIMLRVWEHEALTVLYQPPIWITLVAVYLDYLGATHAVFDQKAWAY